MKYKQFKKRNLSMNTVDLKSYYSDNTRLLRVMKMNELSKYNGQEKLRKELQSNLQRMNTDYHLTNNPTLHKLHEENEKFLTQYKTANKFIKKKSSKETFKNLIKIYVKKGYKIPDLSLKHNLFNLCPLIEKNKEKLVIGFMHEKHLSQKTMTYLHKINDLLNTQININNNKIGKYTQRQSKKVLIKKIAITEVEESNENLIESVSRLMNLINNKILDKIDQLYVDKRNITRITTNRHSSYNTSEGFDFLNIKSHSIRQRNSNRAINNFVICSPGNANTFRLKNINSIRTPSSSRRQSFRATDKMASTLSTNFSTTKTSNFYSNFNKGLCLSLESKYNNIEDLVEYAYERGRKNDYVSLQNALKVFLKKFKGYTDNQIEDMLIDSNENLESDKVIRAIDQTKKRIEKKEIDRKSKNIYLNSHKIKRIKPLLKEMEECDSIINTMDKKLIEGLAPKE